MGGRCLFRDTYMQTETEQENSICCSFSSSVHSHRHRAAQCRRKHTKRKNRGQVSRCEKEWGKKLVVWGGVSTTHIATVCPNTSRCMWTQQCTPAWTGCHQICKNHKAESFSEGCVAAAEGAHVSKAAAAVSLCCVTCQDATWYKNVLTFFSISKCKSNFFFLSMGTNKNTDTQIQMQS